MTSTDPTKKATSAMYPEPLMIPPLYEHRQTFIILHGRGSKAQDFGPPLLETQLQNGRTLQSAFPNAQFTFPTASKRRAKVYKRSLIHQWFDCWSLNDPSEREHLMIDGLRETTGYLQQLVNEAIAEVGAKNVVLGGLSQGCAAALTSFLTWEGEPLAAVFGMSGWLPFRHHMADAVKPHKKDGDDEHDCDNLFGGEVKEMHRDNLPAHAIEWLKEEIGLTPSSASSVLEGIAPLTEPSSSSSPPVSQLSFQRTPISLAHGAKDEKVPAILGSEAKDCLALLGGNVQWREYEDLGHWCSEEMLGDLVGFLMEESGWTGSKSTEDGNSKDVAAERSEGPVNVTGVERPVSEDVIK